MKPTKRQILKRGQTRWELDFGLDTAGKKKRKLFKSEAGADAELERYKKLEKSYGEYWLLMSPLERQSTITTLQEISAKELTLGGGVGRLSEMEPGVRQTGHRQFPDLRRRCGRI